MCVCVQCVSSVFPEDLYLTNLRCKDVVDSASLISPTDGCRVCPPTPQQWVYYLHLSQVNFDCVSCVRPEGLGSPSDMGNCTGKSNDKQNGSAFDRVTSRTSTEDDCLLYQLADYQKGMFFQCVEFTFLHRFMFISSLFGLLGGDLIKFFAKEGGRATEGTVELSKYNI